MITQEQLQKRLLILASMKTLATTAFLLANNYAVAGTILVTLLITIVWIVRAKTTTTSPDTLWKQFHIAVGIPVLLIGITTLTQHPQAIIKTLVGAVLTTKGIRKQ